MHYLCWVLSCAPGNTVHGSTGPLEPGSTSLKGEHFPARQTDTGVLLQANRIKEAFTCINVLVSDSTVEVISTPGTLVDS